MSVSRENLTILERVARADRSAVQDCLDAYGSLIWAGAKNYAASLEEAEIITQEIFCEIWKHAKRFDSERGNETDFVKLLAFRHLIKDARKTKSFAASVN